MSLLLKQVVLLAQALVQILNSLHLVSIDPALLVQLNLCLLQLELVGVRDILNLDHVRLAQTLLLLLVLYHQALDLCGVPFVDLRGDFIPDELV